MATLRSLRHAFAAALAFALLAIGATDAHATHFRYGTIRWEKTDETATQVTLLVTTESAWRCTFYTASGCAALPAVVSTGQSIVVQRINTPFTTISSNALNITRSSTNNAEDWFVGSSQHTFVINKTDLPVRLFWEGAARISTLQDQNNDRNFRVESIVSTNLANAASAASSILPIITVGVGPAVKFFIPAADVQGDTLTWSIAPVTRSQLFKAKPDGNPDGQNVFDVNPATGEVTWNTAAEGTIPANGFLYAVQFIVTDSKGAETPIDALLRIVPSTGNPPQALINGLNSAYSISVRPNNPVLFTVTGSDVDAGATVTLNSGALPPGASMTPTLPTTASSPVNSVFQWTPTVAQAGNNFVISFSATDNFGLQDTNSATITVLNNFPPVASCNADVSVDATSTSGATVTLTTTVSDQDGDGLTVRWYVDTVLSQTDVVPASSGSTPVPFTHTYSAGPAHSVRVEVADGLSVSQCTSQVTVTDQPPTLHLPPSQTLEATGPDGAIAVWSPDPPIATDAVDGTLNATCRRATGAPVSSGSLFAISVNPHDVNCDVTDSGGNHVMGTFTILVRDTTGPMLNLPGPITREATSPDGATVTFTATATDTVDGTVPVTCNPASGSTFAINPPGPVTTVTCSATDSHNNTTTGTFTVTIVDTTPPVLHLPADMIVEATSPAGAVANYTATATDIVDVTVPVTCAPASGSTFPFGVTPVNCTATDAHGNTSTGSFTVTVRDTTPPVLNLPANMIVEATSPAGAIVTYTATATDSVDGPITPVCMPASGSQFAFGVTTVNCTATDAHNNSTTGSFTVTVRDTTPPVLHLPANMVLEATSPAGAVATWTATATDSVDGNLTVTCVPASGSTFALGVRTVNCSATDSHNNTTTGSFTVTVRDTIPPVINNMPANMTREATGPNGATATWPAPTATDVVDTNVPVVCTPASGSTFAINPPGPVTTVTCTATDDSGNSSSRSFTVTVVDTTPPTINNMPANIVVNATGPTGTIVTWPAPTATDLVDGPRPVTCVPPSGSRFAPGRTTVTCTASDTRGNTRTATFTVQVSSDSKPPVVCITLRPGELWPPNHTMRPIQITVTVKDDQDPNPVCRVTKVTSNEPVTGNGWGNFAPDWTFSNLNLQLRSERYSHGGRTYAVTVSCTDRTGNVGVTTAAIRVPHDQRGSRDDLQLELRGGVGITGTQDHGDHDDRGGSSTSCCHTGQKPHGDDDDDDGNHFTESLVPGSNVEKKGGNDHDPRIPPPCGTGDDDDDDGHGQKGNHVAPVAPLASMPRKN